LEVGGGKLARNDLCGECFNPTHHHHARGGELISSDRGVAEIFEDLANTIAKLPTLRLHRLEAALHLYGARVRARVKVGKRATA